MDTHYVLLTEDNASQSAPTYQFPGTENNQPFWKRPGFLWILVPLAFFAFLADKYSGQHNELSILLPFDGGQAFEAFVSDPVFMQGLSGDTDSEKHTILSYLDPKIGLQLPLVGSAELQEIARDCAARPDDDTYCAYWRRAFSFLSLLKFNPSNEQLLQLLPLHDNKFVHAFWHDNMPDDLAYAAMIPRDADEIETEQYTNLLLFYKNGHAYSINISRGYFSVSDGQFVLGDAIRELSSKTAEDLRDHPEAYAQTWDNLLFVLFEVLE